MTVSVEVNCCQARVPPIPASSARPAARARLSTRRLPGVGRSIRSGAVAGSSVGVGTAARGRVTGDTGDTGDSAAAEARPPVPASTTGGGTRSEENSEPKPSWSRIRFHTAGLGVSRVK